MIFGLSEEKYKNISSIFLKFPKIEKVIIYGSRATGAFRTGSDIDLAVIGYGIEFDDILKLHILLDELPYLYTYDIIDYATINNLKLKDRIDKEGKIFYSREIN